MRITKKEYDELLKHKQKSEALQEILRIISAQIEDDIRSIVQDEAQMMIDDLHITS